MSVFRLRSILLPQKLIKPKYYSTATNADEYTATPKYPEILDLSMKKRMERKWQSEHEEIKAVKTVEEKQIKLNMPKYYGFRCFELTDTKVPYNGLNFAQHVTLTHLIIKDELPDYYKEINTDDLDIKADIEEALLMEMDGYKRCHELTSAAEVTEEEVEDMISAAVSKQLNRIIINKLVKDHPHLSKIQVDYEPRIEAFWYAGGTTPSKLIKARRERKEHLKPFLDEPVNSGLTYSTTPNLTLRSELPLPSIINMSESENQDLTVPYFQYDPRVLSIFPEHRFQANIPGFWPGEKNQFGMISFHKRGYILKRSKHYNDPEDDKEALHYQGILKSFAWLHAQANYMGFNTFNDVTYPTVTQTVITNGQMWSFYTYQLNTTLMHYKHITENPRRNICWATPELKMYEEIVDGKLIGFNENVIKMLLKYYLNAPQTKLGVNLRPHLSPEQKLSADYEDPEKRTWLEREYKFLVANRPRLVQMDEVFHWEKIYKIDHQTRFMDKRLKPFELQVKPWNRRLNDRLPNYIPRAHRPDLPRHKGRYAREFWP